MFKNDRIHKAAILPQSRYEIRPDFDPEEYIGNRWGIMRAAGEVQLMPIGQPEWNRRLTIENECEENAGAEADEEEDKQAVVTKSQSRV